VLLIGFHVLIGDGVTLREGKGAVSGGFHVSSRRQHVLERDAAVFRHVVRTDAFHLSLSVGILQGEESLWRNIRYTSPSGFGNLAAATAY